jgi:hypothetical protein
MNAVKHIESCHIERSRDVGVPPPQMQAGSGFPLQVRALITGLAGFPLQSVTRRTCKPVTQEQAYHTWLDHNIYAKYTWLSLSFAD